jgi:glycosyltransferase involved in cell wall biosynthesis
MISGRPGIACGIADYTHSLVTALTVAGVESYSPTPANWSAFSSRAIFQEIRLRKVDLIHIQYPAAAYGAGFAPQGLAFFSRSERIPLVVTVHEFSQTHPLRRMACSAFSIANALVFTNPFELGHFSKLMPWVKSRASVTPVGSSVPFVRSQPDEFDVVYFGLIRAKKGIEAFLDLAALSLRERRPYRFTVVGSAQLGEQEYFEVVRARIESLSNVALESDLEAEAVAQRIAQARFAYLPFPDGVSERRTSLLATMGNGLVVLTTKGQHTPQELNGAVAFVENSDMALNQLDFLSASKEARMALQVNASRYIERFTWESIAQKHLQIYGSLVK